MNSSDPSGEEVRSSHTPATHLESEHNRLAYLFVLALASFVVMSLSVCAFMGKVWRNTKGQAEEARVAYDAMWREFSHVYHPAIQKFVQSLQGFGAQNNDFQPILEKYRKPLADYFGSTTAAPAPAMTPSSTPAPPPPPK